MIENENENEAQSTYLFHHGHEDHQHVPSPRLASYRRGFELLLNVTNLELTCIKSPLVYVNGVSWTLAICKKATAPNATDADTDSSITMEISPAIDEINATRWSCMANALIELIPTNSIQKSLFFEMKTQKFTQNGPFEYEISTGVNSADFMKYYVNSGGDVKFHLNIATDKFRPVPVIEQNSVSFRFILENLSGLNTVFSKRIRIRDIDWRIVAKKNHHSLGLYLVANKNDMDVNSVWQVTASFEVLSFNQRTRSNRKQFTTTFHRRMFNRGISEFMSWDYLTNPRNRYVDLDAAVFQIELKVDEPESLWGIE